ncbi:MAG: hypothetical protein R3Y51_05765 [Rikenellaceae bacterium]
MAIKKLYSTDGNTFKIHNVEGFVHYGVAQSLNRQHNSDSKSRVIRRLSYLVDLGDYANDVMNEPQLAANTYSQILEDSELLGSLNLNVSLIHHAFYSKVMKRLRELKLKETKGMIDKFRKEFDTRSKLYTLYNELTRILDEESSEEADEYKSAI